MQGKELMEFEYTPSSGDYNLINGEKVYKVLEPYYSDKSGIIQAKCPHCKSLVQRIWNLKYCGDCGKPISWNNLYVDNYHPI